MKFSSDIYGSQMILRSQNSVLHFERRLRNVSSLWTNYIVTQVFLPTQWDQCRCYWWHWSVLIYQLEKLITPNQWKPSKIKDYSLLGEPLIFVFCATTMSNFSHIQAIFFPLQLPPWAKLVSGRRMSWTQRQCVIGRSRVSGACGRGSVRRWRLDSYSCRWRLCRMPCRSLFMLGVL